MLSLDGNLCVVAVTYDDVTMIVDAVTITNNNAVSVTFRIVHPDNPAKTFETTVAAGTTKEFKNLTRFEYPVTGTVDATWNWG
jgi:hypothetical protein